MDDHDSKYDLNNLVNSFAAEGYIILKSSFISSADLKAMQAEANDLVASVDNKSLLENGCVLEIIESGTHPNMARINTQEYKQLRKDSVQSDDAKLHSDRVYKFLLENVQFLSIVKAILHSSASSNSEPSSGEEGNAPSDKKNICYFFNEHYVVKPPAEACSSFAWHTDEKEQLYKFLPNEEAASRPKHHHRAYVSCWIPLVDVDANNGSLKVRPFETLRSHKRVRGNDSVMQRAPVTIEAPAGSIVLFSSALEHCSSPNQSQHARPVLYAQYTRTPLHTTSNGTIVFDSRQDTEPLSLAIAV